MDIGFVFECVKKKPKYQNSIYFCSKIKFFTNRQRGFSKMILVQNAFTKAFGIRFPIIMAPMFLVSNEDMIKAGISAGIMATFPSLNYRKDGELKAVLDNLNAFKQAHQEMHGNYGINLIVQKSNPLYEKHLKVCAAAKVPFYITSLGNPEAVVAAAHSYGAKVYADVTNLKHAHIVHEKGCDGFIAVGQGAGGHAGPYPLHVLIPALRKHFPDTPVVAAGGIANGASLLAGLSLGAEAASIGTRFIASTEAGVSDAYKKAIVASHMENIVMTTRLSGTPCTIINTPYAQKIGYDQNWLEKFLSTNSTTKKYFKMLVQLRGFKKLEAAVKPGNYDNLWCAGQSVELINDIKDVEDIVRTLIQELDEAYMRLKGGITS
jgi:nitronate monooxygenase